MRRFIRLLKFLVFIPIAFVVVAVSMANRGPVSVYLDPTGQLLKDSFTMPVYLLVFGCVIAGILLGGWAAWLAQHRNRVERRQYKRELRRTTKELQQLKSA
ncbi:MAG: LapA family protein [Methylobacteriaceae bacterium]|jgi:uncharacterized integral membrane protein|nr:LapA family protein [Methylobacteriaceae bacterium]